MNSRLRKFLNPVRPVRIAAYIAIFAAGAIVGVVLFDRLLMPACTTGSGVHLIPDVAGATSATGVTVEEAEKIARKSGFDFRVMRMEHQSHWSHQRRRE